MTEVMGFPPRGVSAHTPPAVEGAVHDGPKPSHPTLILGGLERGRFAGGESRLGGTTASAPSCGTSPGRSVRGLPTEALTPRHVWPQSNTNTNESMRQESFRNQSEQSVSTTNYHVGFLPRLKSWASASEEL